MHWACLQTVFNSVLVVCSSTLGLSSTAAAAEISVAVTSAEEVCAALMF